MLSWPGAGLTALPVLAGAGQQASQLAEQLPARVVRQLVPGQDRNLRYQNR